MLDQVQDCNNSVIIERDEKAVAALVDAELFARIRRLRERFDVLTGQIAMAYAHVPEGQGFTEINEAVEELRKR